MTAAATVFAVWWVAALTLLFVASCAARNRSGSLLGIDNALGRCFDRIVLACNVSPAPCAVGFAALDVCSAVIGGWPPVVLALLGGAILAVWIAELCWFTKLETRVCCRSSRV